MASCVKCGRYRIRKNLRGLFSCPRCGPRHGDIVRLQLSEESIGFQPLGAQLSTEKVTP